MRAIAIKAFGGPDGLAVTDLAAPEPASGQVLIAAEAIGVGGVDAVIRRGTLDAYGFAAGHVPGGEVAGRVAAAGDGVDAAWIGRRVWAFTGTRRRLRRAGGRPRRVPGSAAGRHCRRPTR